MARARQRRPLLSHDDGLQDLWPSFTDIATTFALILFVLVLLSYMRNLLSSKELRAYELRIASSEKKLGELSGQLALTLREIQGGQARLEMSQRKLSEQQGVITANASELSTLRGRLSSIALLRVEVLEKVKSAIEAVLGAPSAAGAPVVHIGDNGNIVINEGLVFEYNSYAIKPEGERLLGTLARALESVLGDAEVREYVDAIVVQGHTDDRGSGSFNRDLSAKRANAVLDHLFAVNPALEQSYGGYFASSAYSEFRPLDAEPVEAAYERNRRIEISVVLKDTTIPTLIEQYMESIPTSPSPPPADGSPPVFPPAAPQP